MKLLTAILLALILNFQSNAQTWQNIGPGAGSDLHFLRVHPDSANVIYAGGDIEGIFKSSDNGASWKNINNNIAQMPYGGDMYWTNDIVIDPINHETVYYCSGVGLFKSTNGGNTWSLLYPTNINSSADLASVATIAVDSANTNRMFIGLGDGADGTFADFLPFPQYDGKTGIYRSLDGGASWSLLTTGIPDSTSIHSIVFAPTGSDTIVVSTTKGIYRSDDGGNTWISKNIGLPHANTHRLKALNAYGIFTLYLTVKTLGTPGDSNTFAGGIYISEDQGDTWINITANLPKYDAADSLFYDYWKLDVNPLDPDIIFTATVRGSGFDAPGIYATFDGGLTWDYMYGCDYTGWMDAATFFSDPYAFDIVIAPSDTAKIYICADQVTKSSDGGVSWQQAYTNQVGAAWQSRGLELMNTDNIAFDPLNPNRIYIGYDDFGLFRSDDNATTFLRMDSIQDPIIGSLSETDGVKDIQIDPINGDLYVSRWQGSQGGLNAGFTAGGVVFSNDFGTTFSDINGTMPVGRHDLILDKTTGTSGNRTLYSAVYHNGVYKTSNSGTTWTAINTGLGANAQYVWKIAINPNNSQELYLGLNSMGLGLNSLYKSTDGGTNWTVVSSFPTGDVLSIFVNNLGEIYASVTDNFDWGTTGGLYKSTNGGSTWNLILNHPRIVDVEVHPNNNQAVVAVAQQWYKMETNPQGIYLSTDAGASFNNISTNVNHTFFNFAKFNPNNFQELYVGTAGGGLWVSRDLIIPMSLEDINNSIHHVVYPNPFNEFTTILFDKSLNGEYDLLIYDVVGKEVRQINNIDGNKVEINKKDIGKGLFLTYLINHNSGEKVFLGKLISQ